MSIEQILNEMDEVLDKSWGLPLSGGKTVVETEKLRDMIDDIRINLPMEIKQAKAVVADRAEILAQAQKEGEAIIRKAEERSKTLIAQEEVTKAAQARAADILSQAQIKSREIRQAAYDFSDEVLRGAEESVAKALGEVRNTRQVLRGNSRQGRNG